MIQSHTNATFLSSACIFLIRSNLSSGITSDITWSIHICLAINSAVFFVSQVNIIVSIHIE